MKLTKSELADVPGAAGRRSILISIVVDLLINLAESAFEKIVQHVKDKRAAKLAAQQK